MILAFLPALIFAPTLNFALAVPRTQAEDGKILSEAVYAFPAHASAPGYLPGETVGKYWSAEDYRAATEDPRFQLSKLRYESAGLSVVCYLYAPVERSGTRRPAVVFNRGSFVVGDLAPVLAPAFHRFAERGFVVAAPLYRQSDGGEGKDEMGGEDLADLMNVVPLLESLAFVDARNVFLVGESRGGMMTYQAIRDGFPARAAATFGAFTDLGELIESRPGMRETAKAIWPDFDQRAAEIVRTRSAIHWADELKVPLLVMHGGADHDIPVSQSLRLARALKEAGIGHELHVYAGDDHTLGKSKQDALERMCAWFDRYLTR